MKTLWAVCYTKRFLSGPLRGVEAPCRLTYPSRDMANIIAKLFTVGKEGADSHTGSRYVIVSSDVSDATT